MKNKSLSGEDLEKIKEIADIHSVTTSTGATIYLICPKTTIGPQAMAMIQALYSRSPASILSHLLEVATKGADNFMQQYYVDYGHKSIGDLGNILIAVEGGSMLLAKAIQDSQLYAGQEASTRYMDFSDQPFLHWDGILCATSGITEGVRTHQEIIQENWRTFYMENMPVVLEHVKTQNPYSSFDFSEQLAAEQKKNPKLLDPDAAEKWKKGLWLKTMKARAFDIMRGFLPAGATTYVAWWTSISHANDHLSWLRCHVLSEVTEVAQKTEELLKQVYPSSFGRQVYGDREAYKKKWFETEYYLEANDQFPNFECKVSHFMMLTDPYRDMVLTRPKGVDLPWQIGEVVSVLWRDSIDFGSFRDQQRHRAVIQRMGLITAKLGMHEWYLKNLPPALLKSTQKFLDDQLGKIESLGLGKYEAQYLFPMGMKVPTRTAGSLAKVIYLIELRCQRTVHPTFHANAFRLAVSVREQLAQIFNCTAGEIPLYIDEAVGELTLKRGTQDIVRNEVPEA